MSIDKTFAFHKPSTEGLQRVRHLRDQYSALSLTLISVCPPSRQLAVALTELETSAMWAIKAVVFDDPDSEVESRHA